jgi:rhodanese-related sulfurtransferase
MDYVSVANPENRERHQLQLNESDNMNMSLSRTHDPGRARAWFEDKLAFTTGPVELDHMLKAGDSIIVVDVRESEDFAKGHIPGALSLPQERWDDLQGTSRDKMHIFYCYTQTCHLAAQACVKFANRNYSVMELEGGFAAWKAAELDIEREPVNRLKRAGERLLHRRH